MKAFVHCLKCNRRREVKGKLRYYKDGSTVNGLCPCSTVTVNGKENPHATQMRIYHVPTGCLYVYDDEILSL